MLSVPGKKSQKSTKVLEKTDRECRTYCDFGGKFISRMQFVESKNNQLINYSISTKNTTTSVHTVSFRLLLNFFRC